MKKKKIKKKMYHFTIILRPEPDGGFTVIVPALSGCVTYGRTLGKAKAMARDAIAAYIASLKKHNEPIPTDRDTLIESLDLGYVQAA